MIKVWYSYTLLKVQAIILRIYVRYYTYMYTDPTTHSQKMFTVISITIYHFR